MTSCVNSSKILIMISLSKHLANLVSLPKSSWRYMVMGNESGDLDSIASALCYSLLNAEKRAVIPLLNFPRKELSFRKEVLYLFDLYGLDQKNLYFKEDLQGFQGELTLVDHHTLALDQKYLRPLVKRIIDHHPGAPENFPQKVEAEIVHCGSTATLIALQAENKPFSKEASALLLGAILLDTHCLQDPIKTQAADRSMAKWLSGISQISFQPFFETLQGLKEEIKEDEALQRDVKSYNEGLLNYAISSVPKQIVYDSGAWEVFRKEKKVHALFVFVNKADEKGKTLLLYTPFSKLFKELLAVMPFPLIRKEEELAEFLCPSALSRKSLQPLFSFNSPLIQSIFPL